MQGKNNTLQEHDLHAEKIYLNPRERDFFRDDEQVYWTEFRHEIQICALRFGSRNEDFNRRLRGRIAARAHILTAFGRQIEPAISCYS